MSNYCVYMLLQIQDHWRKCKNKLVTRLTRRVPLVEQELPTLPEHLSSPWLSWCSCYSIFVIPPRNKVVGGYTDFTMSVRL